MLSIFIFVQLFTLAAYVDAHCSLVDIHGSNGLTGHAFGVDLHGKYPRKVGRPGDAGGDSTVFQTGTDNPSPACGSTPELGQVDIVSWLSQAEGYGLPSAYSNMSVVITAFQVNRDGGGPMSCQYNEDATATSWKPMTVTLNQAGNNGIQGQNRVNETVVMEFPAGASCTGGWTKTACIVRCRTGVNKRFGGCFAVKLATSSYTARFTGSKSSSATLTSQQLTQIARAVVSQLKSLGLVISKSAKADHRVRSIRDHASNLAHAAFATRSLESRSKHAITDQSFSQIATEVVARMKQSGMVVSKKSRR